MKLSIKAGTTSKSVAVFVQDSSSVIGAGLTAVIFSNVTGYYLREGGSATVITMATLSSITAAYSSGGFLLADNTNMPGIYRFDIPDTALAAGAKWVVIYLKGATNMAPCVLEIELTAVDNQDGVHFGITALPNAAAGTSGGLDLMGNIRFQRATAYSNFVFRMTSSSDHISPATGLTVTCNISKDGNAFAPSTNSVVAISAGWYKVNFTNTEMTADAIALSFTASGADQLDIAVVTQVD